MKLICLCIKKKTLLFFLLIILSTNSLAEVWKLGNILPPDHPANRAAEKAAEEIAELTDNRIEIQVFPAGQIGNAKEILTGMTIGTHQMALDGAGILSQWNSKLGVFEAPYLAKDFPHLKRLVESDKGQELLNELKDQHGLRTLDVWYYGTRQMTNNVRPIEKVEDVKGLKLRVPEVKLSLEFIKLLGGRPTPMAFPELYLGLQTGVVDGQENPLPTINAAKFFEVQDQLALTGHLVQFVAPIVAEDAWTSASEEDKQVVIDVFKRVGDEYSQEVIALEAELINELKNKGMNVTEPDREAFAEAIMPLYGQFESEWGKGTFEALSAVE